MACAACGFVNPDAARFCGGCGVALAATCASCGEPLTPGARFCNACGTPSEAPAGPASPSPPPADGDRPPERRRVSVLFLDLENFTALAESLDPEELRTVQSRYFELARSVVARYGGTIEKFIGDAVMAVWGAPVAHEDDAERAVRAGLELLRGVPRLGGAASSTPLAARAALTTGHASVAVGSPHHGMVAGDLVNTAARLQSRAPTGTLLVDETTRRLAAAAGSYERLRPMRLKGRQASVTAFRVAGTEPVGSARHGAHGGPFVGRERELGELIGLFDSVVRDGRSRLVSLTGIAGIGKSRLAWELYRHIDALPIRVAWHAGRAPAYGNDTAFAAVEQMVRRRVRLTDDAGAELGRRQLASALREVVRDDDERRWMEARLLVLIERQGVATYERDELFAAWRRFFERVAERGPTVLLFEDLQWADQALLDFVEHLATWSVDHPLLLLASARPELFDLAPSWGTGIRTFTSIHVDRLPAPAMRELLHSHAPRLDGALVEQVVERAGGVPLYAVEVARILEDARRPDGGEERRRAPRRAASGALEAAALVVPDSLHGVIAARIDTLEAGERRLLMAAAVLGRRFTLEALEAVAGREESSVRDRIGRLVRRELLAFDDELNSSGRGQLHFVQDLVREVAYGMLSRTERRTLHVRAARFLDRLADDDSLAESRAAHLIEAHRLSPDHADAPRLARRAVAALRQAARDAVRLHVPDRAHAHLELALRLAPAPEQRAVVLADAASAAAAADRLDVAEGHLRELVQVHEAEGRVRQAAEAQAQLAGVLLTAQHNDSALAELEKAVTAIGDPIADRAGVELASQLARGRMLIGDYATGLTWAERALEAAERLGMAATAADVLATRGTIRFHLGEQATGLADLHEAIGRAQSENALSVELRARNNLAWLSVADDPRATTETARYAVALATAMGVGDMAAQLASVACTAAVDTGEWDWSLSTAADLEQRGVADAHRIDLAASSAVIRAFRGDPRGVQELERLSAHGSVTDPQLLAAVDHARAWAAFVDGDFDAACELADRAAAGALGAEKVHHHALAARAALWGGHPSRARRSIEAIRRMGISGRAVEATTLTLEAGLRARKADGTARDAYRDAADRWRALDLPLHLALCLLDQHRLLEEPAEPGEGLRLLDELDAAGLIRLVRRPSSPASRGRRGPQARSRRPTARTGARSDGGRRGRASPGGRVPPG